MADKKVNPQQDTVDALVREARGYIARHANAVKASTRAVSLAVHAAKSADAEELVSRLEQVYEQIDFYGGNVRRLDLPKTSDLPTIPAFADAVKDGAASK